MRRLLAGVAIAASLAGATCGAVAEEILVNGVPRTYVLVQPSTTARAPLIVGLHGMGGSGRQFATGTGWAELARTQRVAAVFPDAIDANWQLGLLAADGNTDIQFIVKLVQKLVADATADPRRVYVTGVSRGGAMTYTMVCAKAQMFAAAAPIVVSGVVGFDRVCHPYRPVPILLMNGTADPLIPYDGGRGTGPTANFNLMPTPEFLKFWETTNGCTSRAKETQLPDLDKTDSSTVALLTATCPAGRDVLLYRVNGGGHSQPRRPAPIAAPNPENGPQNHDIDGASTIWSFFQKFAL